MLVLHVMNGNDPVTRRLPVDDVTVSAALGLARDFSLAARISIDTSARLAIIVEELVLNLIEHGGARGEIAITLAATAGGISLMLVDSGRPHDPRAAATTVPPVPERGGGVGLTLVRAWAHIVSYARENGQNCLKLMLPY